MKKQFLMAMILMAAVGARAEDAATTASQTTNTMNANVSDTNKAQVKDIDDEITNARLRAQLGSKSRWSFKSALGYSGGSINEPTSDTRPNYRASATVEGLPGLAGTIGINYRLTERDNLSLNTGINIVDPLHGGITKPVFDPREGENKGKSISRYQVATPSLDWSRGYKAFGIQNISEATLSYNTDSDSADLNALGDLALSQTVLADLGASNWSGGLAFTYDYSFYGGSVNNKDYVPALEAHKLVRSDMMVALYPFAEYAFNDKYSFRTVFGYFEFFHNKAEYNNRTTFYQQEPYQSVGVGISVTRDIYVYPNIQFAPKDIRADRTNVALSKNINI